MNILAVFAHPDDEVLGAGGTIARYAEEGHYVAVAFLTSGRIMRDDYIKAASALGASITRCGPLDKECAGIVPPVLYFADQELDKYPLLELIEAMPTTFGLVELAKPDLLITHYLHDLNLDHQLTARAALTAFRDCPRVLMCRPIPHALPGHPFEPNYWVKLHADHLVAAARALACYKSEAREYPHWRSPEKFLNRLCELPNNYATEPFMAVRWIDELPGQSVLPSDRK